jgi:hypothetical protein
MDKASERKKDAKACGDTDIGVHKYGPCNVREQLPSLWDHAGKEVVGLGLERLLTNEYSKLPDKDSKDELIEDVISSGPPFSNVSNPKRVL